MGREQRAHRQAIDKGPQPLTKAQKAEQKEFDARLTTLRQSAQSGQVMTNAGRVKHLADLVTAMQPVMKQLSQNVVGPLPAVQEVQPSAPSPQIPDPCSTQGRRCKGRCGRA